MSVAAVATAPEAIAGDSKHVAVKAIDDLLQRILEYDQKEEAELVTRLLQQQVTIVMGACNAQAKRDMPGKIDNHHTHTFLVQGPKAAQDNPHLDTMQFIGTHHVPHNPGETVPTLEAKLWSLVVEAVENENKPAK